MLELLLLTPMMLASEPVRLTVDPASYSHELQQSVLSNGEKQIAQAGGRTWSGTATYTPGQGVPSDNDND